MVDCTKVQKISMVCSTYSV